ncbi:hypothetical protein MNEG_16640 [Monoraphidium neglectum]|uniref:Uncharacterized protein n=1 Tax=Monoraphidium neglectum TaxID=145388 RepID=A0A0D2LH06_9CHLO|nr:hypothetical protein MNEG_16640 [Monoraphidium neglectum]KIY91324.1 hypothetical protein MNEG_16640 [Monoraphidium neglectum]|eukprot:XP_013890344.1 hypothetical protein MNEG_16640 [Monoraphidium neglectum]
MQVCHVQLDPLQVTQVARLDLSDFQAAIVLCDEGWVEDGDAGGGGPEGRPEGSEHATDQPGVLRLDSLVMMVQLNIRKCLADRGLPPINIICQKDPPPNAETHISRAPVTPPRARAPRSPPRA